jgi:hypothetical protein
VKEIHGNVRVRNSRKNSVPAGRTAKIDTREMTRKLVSTTPSPTNPAALYQCSGVSTS